ncbi:MAG: 5-formyltetrahydrofolate cyclo-ligase [Clostridia bacterium]|nr:5-formyltetrahydrofolate cyclo-ligase [Clostridia bacterium]
MRSALRARMRGLPSQRRCALSAAACDLLVQTEAFERADMVLAYMPLPYECSPLSLCRVARRMGKRVAFPLCCEGGVLELYSPLDADSDAAFAVGAYGILEPVRERCVEVALDDVALIIAPGIAYSVGRVRLGQGGGYYDRLLAGAHAHKVGLCFPFQVLDDIPFEPHDAVMDAIVSADGII